MIGVHVGISMIGLEWNRLICLKRLICLAWLFGWSGLRAVRFERILLRLGLVDGGAPPYRLAGSGGSCISRDLTRGHWLLGNRPRGGSMKITSPTVFFWAYGPKVLCTMALCFRPFVFFLFRACPSLALSINKLQWKKKKKKVVKKFKDGDKWITGRLLFVCVFYY